MNQITQAKTDSEVICLWLSDKSLTTQVSYRSTVTQFIRFINKPLVEVALEDLHLWVRRLKLTDKTSTMANKILVVKSLFSFCVRVGYLTVNVGSFLKYPKVKDNLAERILPESDCLGLIGAARTERDRCLLSLMYVCGLRVSEVCGLTWNDLQPHDEISLMRWGESDGFRKGVKNEDCFDS